MLFYVDSEALQKEKFLLKITVVSGDFEYKFYSRIAAFHLTIIGLAHLDKGPSIIYASGVD